MAEGEASNGLPLLNDPLPVVRLPGNPDPEAEVIALSPNTLMETYQYFCQVCGKGFQREQNLQLHRRGHNLPWKLKQRTSNEKKKRVYVCPEKTCVHHHPSRAIGDLTGIKKHYGRKHGGEKKWKCEKCSKLYAVKSDWKAHSKTCDIREYKCNCGLLFTRRDRFISHRAFCHFCNALAEETPELNAASNINYSILGGTSMGGQGSHHVHGSILSNRHVQDLRHYQLGQSSTMYGNPIVSRSDVQPSEYLRNQLISTVPSLYTSQHQSLQPSSANMSAAASSQKATQIGASSSDPPSYLEIFGLKLSHGAQDQIFRDGDKFYGAYNSNSVITSVGSELENSGYDLSQMPPKKRLPVQTEESAEKQTRDFLSGFM